MKTKFIEATDSTHFNWGKFAVCRFSSEELAYRSQMDENNLIASRGWSPQHIFVLDLETGEGAMFMPGGLAQHDLNQRHQIWTCPMFEPFLVWLYRQDLTNLDQLPGLVNLGDVPTAMYGYRRKGKKRTRKPHRPEKDTQHQNSPFDSLVGRLGASTGHPKS